MNGPEILHLIRHDLQCAVARQGEPPTPRPMDASPWVAMSAMQKAIRRGREDLALSAAATLLRDTPDKLWRRIGCIAYEDVGLASLEAVGLATVALTGAPPLRSRVFSKLMRPQLGGCGATSTRRTDSHSSGISSSGSRAGLSSIECRGRWRTSFAAKSTMSARVPPARTPPTSST